LPLRSAKAAAEQLRYRVLPLKHKLSHGSKFQGSFIFEYHLNSNPDMVDSFRNDGCNTIKFHKEMMAG
jgi:hypothetical protein